MELLADLHRLQCCVLADAPDWTAWDATPRLHVWSGVRLEYAEYDHDGRRICPCARYLLFLINIFVSLRRGAPAGANPWDAPTLEWATSSPPPPYNFVVIPTVASRHPLWEDRLRESNERSSLNNGMALADGRETIATTPLDAEPDAILKMPDDTYAPLILALSLAGLFTAMLAQSLVGGILALVVGLIAILTWLWPERVTFRPMETSHG